MIRRTLIACVGVTLALILAGAAEAQESPGSVAWYENSSLTSSSTCRRNDIVLDTACYLRVDENGGNSVALKVTAPYAEACYYASVTGTDAASVLHFYRISTEGGHTDKGFVPTGGTLQYDSSDCITLLRGLWFVHIDTAASASAVSLLEVMGRE